MDQIFCQHCGSANAADAKYCNKCGAPILLNTPPAYAPPPPPPQYNPPPAVAYQPPPAAPQMNMPQPPKSNKKVWVTCLVVAGVLALLSLICAGGFGYYMYSTLSPVSGVANDFLTALKNQDYNKAYDMSSIELQSDVVSPEGFKEFMEANNYYIQSWSIDNTQKFDGTPATALASGTVTFKDGTKTSIEVHCVMESDSVWKVKGLRFPEK